MRVFYSVPAVGITITLLVFPVLVLYAEGNIDKKTTNPAPGDTYFGQKPPGAKAVQLAPDVMTLEAHDSPVVSPDEDWIYYSAMGADDVFYALVDGSLSVIENPLGIEFPHYCNGVAISPSGNRIYIEEWRNGANHLYYLDKAGDKWTSPTYVDLTSSRNWWQISIASSGSLYLSAGTVMVSALESGSHVKPVPLRLENNSDMKGDTPFISPDESYIIYSIEGDLHISYRRSDGMWTIPQDLGPDINSDYLDICPQITPNGKYMLFATRRNFPTFTIYWVDANFVEDLRPQE